MATDVQILSAARDVAAAITAMQKAVQVRIEKDREATVALNHVNECQRRCAEAERHLLTLSRKEPLEPAPLPTIVQATPVGGPSPAPNGLTTHRRKEKV